MSDQEERIRSINAIQNASPLEITDLLIRAELYDRKSSQEIIDEVYEQFAGGGHLKQSLLMPVFLCIADGVIEAIPNAGKLREKGLTATRIVQDCENFTYESSQMNVFTPDGYQEYKNARDYNKAYAEDVRGDYDRTKIVNQHAMDKYKSQKAAEANGNKNMQDEYTGLTNITAKRDNPDLRRNDPTNRFQTQPDHIVPLKKVHEKLAGNYALSENDIRMIANLKENLAVTSAKINQEKLDKTNIEYVRENKLDETTASNMVRKENEAKKALDRKTNEVVLDNLTGQGTVSSADKKHAVQEFIRENNRIPSKEEREKIERKLQREKTTDVYGQTVQNAGRQATNYAIGNVVLFVLKPIYYEFKDILTNGLTKGVGVSSGLEAIKIRFTRIKKFMVENVVKFIGDNLIDFVKGFISSLVEGIISLFVGVFKQILKVVKEGIKVFMRSAKVLFGKESSAMTAAQKGDAIIKILGGTVIALAGIGIEALLNKIGVVAPWSVVLSTMLSGIASALFMYLMDKIDLFSVKAEKRYLRIKEIFEERIQDIEVAKAAFDLNAIQTLKAQRLQFDGLSDDIASALDGNNLDAVNSALFRMADFFKVSLPYRNTVEFVKYFDSSNILEI